MGDINTYISYALELSMAIPAAAMALIPMHKYLRFPARVVYSIAALLLIVLIAAGTVLCWSLNIVSNMVLVPAAILLFAPYAASIDLSLSKKAFCYANAAMLTAFATMWAIGVGIPWEANNNTNALLPQTAALALAEALVVGLLFGRTLVVKLPALLSYAPIDAAWRGLTTIPLFLAIIIHWMIPINPSLMLLGRTRIIYLVITPAIPLMALLLYHIAWWIAARMDGARKLEREVTLLRAEEKRYAELQNYMHETRELRHDYRHHLLALLGMAEAEKHEELHTYLSQLADAEKRSRRAQLCLNPAVDAVAAHYDEIARSKGVEVSWGLNLPEQLPVAEADLCGVLGNLVENAINAVSNLAEDKRVVEVTAGKLSSAAIGVRVTNPYEGGLRTDRNGLPTSDRKGHGYGLTSAKTTAKKNGGELTVYTDNDTFSAGVVMFH